MVDINKKRQELVRILDSSIPLVVVGHISPSSHVITPQPAGEAIVQALEAWLAAKEELDRREND